MMELTAFVGSFRIIITLLIFWTKSDDAYNIEERNFGIAKGHKDSQFGYTVALVPSPGSNTNESKFNNKTLLIGAPNETHDGIRGHGHLYECSDILTKEITCKVLNTSGSSGKCDKIRKGNKNRSFCELNSRLGSSLAVNTYYIENMNISHYDTIPMVMVCAPRWKNTYYETKKELYQNYMVGKCIKLTENLKTIPCEKDGQFGSRCWPFWPRDETEKGRPMFSYAEAGMSLAFTKDGYDIVGGPGVNDWKGAFRTRKNWNLVQIGNVPHTTYFGYDLKTGRFQMDADIVVGAPNYHKRNVRGHVGQVVIYKGTVKKTTINYGFYYDCPDNKLSRSDFEKLIKTKQNGNKFGAVLESADLNNDGFDEILVAAPLYTGEYPDEGRVFVYNFSFSGVCGPIAVLSGGAHYLRLKDKTKFARFGSCITSVGDLDQDQFNDVAVGAPYEENGVGAVYIYYGVDSTLKDKFTQRITGKTVDPGIRTFGWSMYGKEDIDDNGFPDIAVGAYESDSVVVLRTRPVVSVNVDIKIDPSPIPLNNTLQLCSENVSQLCFHALAKFSFTTLGHRDRYVKSIALILTMKADTLYMAMENTSRVAFLETNSNILLRNITLEKDLLTNVTIPLIVLGNPEPTDVWKKVRVESRIDILESSDFDLLDPVMNKDNVRHKIIDVEFEKKCNKLEECESDLQVKLTTVITGKNRMQIVANDTEIYVGEATELMISVDLRSVHGISHDASFTLNVSAQYARPINPDNGIIGATCEVTDPTYTGLKCTANNRLFLPRNVKVKVYYDISSSNLLPDNDLDRMKEFIKIQIEAEQQNPDVNTDNNIVEASIPVKLKHNIVIQEDDNVEDQIFYEDDVNSERHLCIKQRYYVSNRGPSFLHLTYVNISIPVMKHGVQIAVIKNISNMCSKGGNLDDMPMFMADEDLGRGKEIHKEVNASVDNNEANDDDNYGNMNIISCLDENYHCDVIVCKLTDMEPNKQVDIEFEVDVLEKELAKETVYGIRYATFADVTDPYIWYGNKSVEWTKLVYAQKWTTFVHKQNLAKPKVQIWILIVSVVGGMNLLTAIIIILWKCKFFERKRRYQILDWKEKMKEEEGNDLTSENKAAEETEGL